MSWYKIAQRTLKVRSEYWKALDNWVLVDANKPRDRNLRPLGKTWKQGIGQDVFEFESKKEAEKFAMEKGWEIA